LLNRIDRVNSILKRELTSLIATEIRDPRLDILCSITKIRTSADLGKSVIHVSIMGDINHQKQALEGLVSAAGFLRVMLGKILVFKKIPELEFLLDDSLDEEERIFSLLDNN